MTLRNSLCGRSPHDVIALLKRRREQGYHAGKDEDGNRLGLVVEGGAMRGVISSGAVEALFRLGYGACFDEVHGTSSGALNAAYFVSGQIIMGTTIYYENAVDPRFLNLRRWPGPLDLAWLFDNWIMRGKPLDIARIMRSGSDLFIAATDTQTGHARFFSNRDNRPEIIIPSLRASCATPLFVTHREPIDGSWYNDGLAQACVPAQRAMKTCTHVIAALTRPLGYRKRRTLVASAAEAVLLRSYAKSYRDIYSRHHMFYNEALDFLCGHRHTVPTLLLAPRRKDFVVGVAETRPEALKRAAHEAMARVTAIFDVSDSSFKAG